jgi:Acyltransferase
MCPRILGVPLVQYSSLVCMVVCCHSSFPPTCMIDSAMLTGSYTYRAFFQSGKVLPVTRGGGLEQPSLHIMARQLAIHGDWLHVFPEGRISYDGRVGDLRWGVGRMICDCAQQGK